MLLACSGYQVSFNTTVHGGGLLRGVLIFIFAIEHFKIIKN